MTTTRSGCQVSEQIGKMGAINTLQNGKFSLPDGQIFNIKNDGDEAVQLEVQLAGMDDNEFITTTFEVGWNPEIVKAIKSESVENLDLKWGY